MKKYIITILIIICSVFCISTANAEEQAASYPEDVNAQEIADDEYAGEIDVEQMYRDMPVPEFKYVHSIDSRRVSRHIKFNMVTVSAFQINLPLYFKSIAIEPGYYLLTPREHKGAWYILFKQAGRVRYIVPCYKKEMVPLDFYKNNLPQN